MKLRQNLPNLRTPAFIVAAARAFLLARARGLIVVHFSVQSNHLHLVCDTKSKSALESGMRSLGVSLARAIQKIFKITGRIFEGRYHLHVLKTPSEVKAAIKYVLFNWSRHLGTAKCVDPFSSVYFFEELRRIIDHETLTLIARDFASPPKWMHLLRISLAAPTTWLLRKGWHRGR